MKFTLIHPTRHRPQQAFATHAKWMSLADDFMHLEYILSVDKDDTFDYKKTFWQANVVRNDNKTAIEAINFAAKKAKGDVLIVVSDDTDAPENWDTLLCEALTGKSDFVAKVDDGIQPTLVTMPIMDRKYYKRYGYIYNPLYDHLFVDQELTAVAIMTGKYIKLPLTFPHLHYTTGATQRDALNIRNDSTWLQGEMLFAERLKTNFGIDKPVVPYSAIVWK